MHHQIRLQSRFKGKQAPNVESLSANKILLASDPQIQRLTPSGANRNVTLPDPATLAGHWFLIGNPTGTSYAIVVKKSDASTLITLAAGEQALLIHTGTDFVVMASTDVDFGSSGFKADILAESTSGAGVTVDGLLLKDGKVLNDDYVKATVAVADATGGATGATLTVDLTRLDGTTVLAGARQILVRCGAAQYAPQQTLESSVTFGTATKGSIIANAAGWVLAETDADGEFDCTVTNTDDETLYFWVETATQVSDITKACIVAGSNSDSATWSA